MSWADLWWTVGFHFSVVTGGLLVVALVVAVPLWLTVYLFRKGWTRE